MVIFHLYIVRKDHIKLLEKINLKFVLYVPKLAYTLSSVSKLFDKTNCWIIFFNSHYEFQDQNSKRTIGNAKMINGLYYFGDTLSTNKTTQGLNITSLIYVHE